MRWKPVLGTALLIITLTLVPATAQPPAGVDTPDDEILVLLRPGPGFPTAREVVSAINNGTPIPGGLSEGGPNRGELVIPERSRARGAAAERLLANPDLARARLERYINLQFNNPAAIPGTLTALQANPNVEFAERNRALRLHAASTVSRPKNPIKSTQPQDPYFPPQGSNPDPETYQWGHRKLNLTGAWSFVEARSTVAVLDTGLQLNHPDLRAFDDNGAFLGGNFRDSMSFDYIQEDCTADEMNFPNSVEAAGHGTHVSGIISATANNLGGVGACRNCPIAMARMWTQNQQGAVDDAVQAITDMVDRGVALINMSFGFENVDCDNQGVLDLSAFCNILTVANVRDILVIASVGNDRAVVEFPAKDPRVIGAGGISPDGSLWDDSPNCPDPDGPNGSQVPSDVECGSNIGEGLELLAPAKSVLSTVYTNADQNIFLNCGDSSGADGDPSDGLGTCTGTSMSAAYITAVAAHLDSGHPLLSQDQNRAILKQMASGNGVFNAITGYGIPNTGESVKAVLGFVNGEAMVNRVTPLFTLYRKDGTNRATTLLTTSPQRAVAAIEGTDGRPFTTVGDPVPDYSTFPGVPEPSAPTQIPRAYAFLFTTPNTPSGQTFDLIPIYRMSKDPNRQEECTGTVDSGAKWRFAYARTHEIPAFRNLGYSLSGIEGYMIAPHAGPPTEPHPAGLVALHRLYSADLDDWVVVPERVVQDPAFPDSYAPHPDFDDPLVGLAVDNADSDGDAVVDGYEEILRTNPAVADSDGDGVDDGDEILGYTGGQQPLGGGVLGDPLCALPRCYLFTDGFETGDTARWSSVEP